MLSAPLRPPSVPDIDVQEEFAAIEEVKRRSCLAWARGICAHRELWKLCAISNQGPEPEECWLVMVAKQQPYEVTFLQLR